MSPKKIVVIGPESTGKSTLCEGLAAHFQTLWVPEYAREYLLRHGKTYNYDDLVTIAEGQLALEDASSHQLTDPARKLAPQPDLARKLAPQQSTVPDAHTTNLLFIDTDMYVMKVWSEYVFDRCDLRILDHIAHRHYDGYLLCRTDLPWAPDELREYPDLETREQLFHIYRDCLIQQGTPWLEIGGQSEERLKMAISAVSELLSGE